MAVTAGRGLVGVATVVVEAAVEAEGGVIDLFAGLLEYICGILMLLTPRRTVLKGDGSGEKEREQGEGDFGIRRFLILGEKIRVRVVRVAFFPFRF